MKARRLILALLVMVFTAITTLAEVYTGSCGDNATYTLDTESGLLKIEGSGEISFSSYYAPWHINSSYITKAEISDGITSIGDHAFYDCSRMT